MIVALKFATFYMSLTLFDCSHYVVIEELLHIAQLAR